MKTTNKKYITPVLVGYIDLGHLEVVEGKLNREILEEIARFAGTTNSDRPEISISLEDLDAAIDEAIKVGEVVTDKQKIFLSRFLSKCVSLNCNGDLLMHS